ncbi:MAG: cytochrome c oxidase accessory protein CcoG [Burkholderiales bacterium]|jgi:cytochrome c oxidase accessory protein FixG|nr:cytochrome c oxidase accessory protein CcoG [Burkholderiales bacterium]
MNNSPAGNGTDSAKSLFLPRRKLYTRIVQGTFQNWRIAFVLLSQVIFLGLPWLTWGGRQALLFDLPARKFYLFGTVFWPQDIIYLTALLIVSAYSLFLFTAVAGRLWCGYACPQTVYTELLMWIEQAVEGNRNARMKRDAAPWSAQKAGRKALKHGLWLLVAWWTGVTFVGYFTPIRELVTLLPFGVSGWALFWILLYGGMVYFLAGWMREQVCKYMCPYARFQSAMFDRDTMIITYDAARGEPRGARNRKADLKEARLGHCIDCDLCVQVCPTGIDIRNGLQYECIGCAACIDVCDSMMKKMDYPLGLVRYTTENAMASGYGKKEIWKRVLRLRTLIYAAILLAIMTAVVVSLCMRNPLKVDVLRDRGVMAREAAPGVIENVYRLQIMNTEERAHRFIIEAKATELPGIEVGELEQPINVDAASTRMVPLSVRFKLPREGWEPGMYPMMFTVQAVDDKALRREEKSTFMVPKN